MFVQKRLTKSVYIIHFKSIFKNNILIATSDISIIMIFFFVFSSSLFHKFKYYPLAEKKRKALSAFLSYPDITNKVVISLEFQCVLCIVSYCRHLCNFPGNLSYHMCPGILKDHSPGTGILSDRMMPSLRHVQGSRFANAY